MVLHCFKFRYARFVCSTALDRWVTEVIRDVFDEALSSNFQVFCEGFLGFVEGVVSEFRLVFGVFRCLGKFYAGLQRVL